MQFLLVLLVQFALKEQRRAAAGSGKHYESISFNRFPTAPAILLHPLGHMAQSLQPYIYPITIAIGLSCVMSTSTKVVNSGLRGTTQALYVLAGFKTNRYEFIFTNLAPNCVRHYMSVVRVHKAYAGSRMYRDLKLRGAIINSNQLRMLSLEKICLHEQSIWNLFSESGHLGTMIVTNVRIVWYADINHGFNISMPYITVESITLRDSKFGEALVFVVRPPSGGYVLGFRADPQERLKHLYNELTALHQAYNERPIFGLEMNWDNEILVAAFGRTCNCLRSLSDIKYVRCTLQLAKYNMDYNGSVVVALRRFKSTRDVWVSHARVPYIYNPAH